MSELEKFRRVAGDNLLRSWLEDQKLAAVKTMSASTDLHLILRAQGAYQFAVKQLDLLDKAKDLR